MSAAVIRQANELLAAGRLVEADERLREHLSTQPGSVDALELLGVVLLQRELFDEAVEACLQALRIDPARRDPYRTLARAHWLAGRPHEAARVLMNAVAQRPADSELHLEAAVALRDAGFEEQALSLLEATAERCGAARWEAEHLRVELYLTGGRYPEARAAALDVLSRAADDIAAWDRLAIAAYQMGDLEAAIDATQQLALRTPGVMDHQLRLAGLLREAGELGRAMALWEHVAGCGDTIEHRQAAGEALRTADELQLPLLVALASDSRALRRELRNDPLGGSRRRGFHLSQPGAARLVAALEELDGAAPEQRQ